jgi:hypothetical protein
MRKYEEPDPEQNQNSETKDTKNTNIALFVKVGIIVLSII